MKRCVLLTLLTAAVGACGSMPAVAPSYSTGPPTGAAGVVDTPIDRPFAEVSRARGMPALAAVVLPEGSREIRITDSYGMIAGRRIPMRRVFQSADGWGGELLTFWAQLDTAERVEGASCVPLRDALVTCVIVRREGIDWDEVAAELDRLGAWTLSESCSAELVSTSDGGDLLIQRLEGRRFDAYVCNAPRARTATDAGRRSLALWNYVLSWGS